MKTGYKYIMSNARRIILVVFLLVVLIVCSLAVYNMFVVDKGDTHVTSEIELRNAIDKVQFGESAVIVIDRDIALIGEVRIPVGKTITLISKNSNSEFKLIGASGVTTLGVEGGGELRLDGLIVTHTTGATGRGVEVYSGGTLFMYSGSIQGNTADYGAGVYNSGSFMMHGGEIFNNKVTVSGGGVFNNGGDGVFNNGVSFVMYGGKIFDNIANSEGGGVHVTRATFSMYSGEIFGNTASVGGGVLCFKGVFNKFDGTISGNTATYFDNDVYQYTY